MPREKSVKTDKERYIDTIKSERVGHKRVKEHAI